MPRFSGHGHDACRAPFVTHDGDLAQRCAATARPFMRQRGGPARAAEKHGLPPVSSSRSRPNARREAGLCLPRDTGAPALGTTGPAQGVMRVSCGRADGVAATAGAIARGVPIARCAHGVATRCRKGEEPRSATSPEALRVRGDTPGARAPCLALLERGRGFVAAMEVLMPRATVAPHPRHESRPVRDWRRARSRRGPVRTALGDCWGLRMPRNACEIRVRNSPDGGSRLLTMPLRGR